MRKYIEVFFENDNEKLFVCVVFFFLFLFIFVKLENVVMTHHDEITHACIGKMILKFNDWFTMHEGKEISFLKPPLYFWLEALFFKMFGYSNYAARLPAAISGCLVVVLSYFLVLYLFNRRIAVITLLILSTSFYFLKYSKIAMLDMPIAFTTILGLYSFVKYEFYNRRKYIYLFSVAAILGYYFKAVQGTYLLVILPFYYIFVGKIEKIIKKEIIFAYLLFLFGVSLWFVPQLIKYGNMFLYSQCGIGPIVNRGLEGYNNKFYEPFIKLIGLNFPWGLINLLSLIFIFKKIKGKEYFVNKDNLLLVLSSFFIILLILSFSKTFFLRYLLPLFVIFSIIGAIGLYYFLKEDKYYLFFKKVVFIIFIFNWLKTVIFPLELIDKNSTPYYALFMTINYLDDINKNEIVVYAEKYYKLNQGLSYYADVFPKRYIKDVEEFIKTYNLNEYYISDYNGFLNLTKKFNDNKIKILASDNKKWVLFKVIKR